ncbi:MAG: hypothetical protein ABR992_01665, partial [Solirubrobacteraceae bacterium]
MADGAIAFRVRIGVTGHRQIIDEGTVATEVADRLEAVREMFPATRFTPVVFSVLSALAEGADRLVAKVALDAGLDLDVELGAVLPLTVEDYMADFAAANSRA